MTNQEEIVKWPSKKKYPCKRNKGEHEYLEPTILFKPQVRYFYKHEYGILNTHELTDKYPLLKTEISIALETRCKHCGHKAVTLLSDNIK